MTAYLQALAQWPAPSRHALTGVLTDIDDTLTTQGAITDDALAALHALHRAGVAVLPITGRPLGWCAPFLDPANPARWPVPAIVAENGAAAWVKPHFFSKNTSEPASDGALMLQKIYQLDTPVRLAHAQRLQAVAARVEAAVPGVHRSRDSDGRETDIAFDYAEFDRHPPATVHQVLALLQGEGLHTAVSSIHIHGCVQRFDKWDGARWIVRTLWGRDLAAERERWAFVGDSGNDAPLFAQLPHSVGVANVVHALDALPTPPRYLCTQARGAGFAELAHHLLQERPA